MLRVRNFLILFSLLTAPAAAQPQGLGIFGLWGAFEGEGRCYAISEPVRSVGPAAGAFVSVGHWPRRRGGVFHVRLGEEKRPQSAVLLRIDGRSFQLVGAGRDAWAPDAAAEREILARMRTGLNLSVETRASRGTVLRNHYQLRGAASAMDAAAIACAPRSR
jgi:hypothetical protein